MNNPYWGCLIALGVVGMVMYLIASSWSDDDDLEV